MLAIFKTAKLKMPVFSFFTFGRRCSMHAGSASVIDMAVIIHMRILFNLTVGNSLLSSSRWVNTLIHICFIYDLRLLR